MKEKLKALQKCRGKKSLFIMFHVYVALLPSFLWKNTSHAALLLQAAIWWDGCV